MFCQAERMDMVEITHRVAGNGARHFRMCVVLASVLLLAGCAYFGVRWAGGDVGKTASDVETYKRMAANEEGEHNLPWFPPPFIGRDENVSHITNMLLLDPRICGVHITGAPAIGKSHLAVHVGYELVGHGVNIRYIDVSETQLLHDPKESDLIVQQSSNSVKENNQDSTAVTRRRTNLMLSWFSPQEHNDISVSASNLVNWARGVNTTTTIILDNCDGALQGALNDTFLDLIQKLQRASKYVKIISTSRVLFTLVGVKHFPLGGLEENSSTDLLQQECEKFQVEEIKVVADLVGHNPLGLRLAAKLACDVMTVKELIKSLRANSVKTLSSEPISDNQKMQFVIETSIKYLEKEIILCARNISLFPGSFSNKAGVSILSGCGVEDAIYCLNTLSHKSLLEWYAVRGDTRYRYHQLVRDAFVAPDLLKDTHNKSEAEEAFFEQYSKYFVTHLKETLEDCETGQSKYCEYWIHDEECNIEFVLTAILQFSQQKSVKYHLYWSKIVRNPTFLKIYGEQKSGMLLLRQVNIIVDHFEQKGEWDISLIAILHELLILTTEWHVYLLTVVCISSPLMSRFIILLQSHGRHSNSVVGVVGMNVLASSASLLASTTPALCTTWLVLFCVSYGPHTVDSSFYIAILSFSIMYVVKMDLKLSVILWLCFLHSIYAFDLYFDILFLPFLPFLLVAFHVVVQGVDYTSTILLLLFFLNLFYGDFSTLVPIFFLSKVIIVVWFVWMIGISSFLKHKQNIFLIILVVCGDSHSLKPSYISLHQPIILPLILLNYTIIASFLMLLMCFVYGFRIQ